jgi:hypothetical protein
VLIIEGYIVGIPSDLPPPTLPPETVAAVKRAKLILVQPELPEAVQSAERELWHQHLAALSEHDADAVEYALAGFVQILNGVLSVEDGDE